MAGYKGALLGCIYSLLLVTQISAEFGQKSPSSGLGPGPGPGGGVSRTARQRSRASDIKAPPRTAVSTSQTSATRTRTSSSRSTPPLSTSPAVNVSRARSAKGPLAASPRVAASPVSGLKHEIFFLNIEEGYFGCQVNESTDVLQLYDISKLCNGVPECFLGSDENRAQLKCTNDCLFTTGVRCQNGACLDHQCYCNDGYGGKGCSMPDENECKYRPCDVFAQCTNTLGSFFCSCFPGYEGNGFTCTDIDECKIPELAAKCVDNAECCNLPAHYVCKCKAGFEGDGEKECVDIDECSRPDACGHKALCQNTPGNYTCSCPTGYGGNPYDGCADIDECELGNACGRGSLCTNNDGGYLCQCPPGFSGDPKVACEDIDECSARTNACGRNALCLNSPGSFRCECPSGFRGNPADGCEDVNECLTNPCGANAVCTDTVGSYTCTCKTDYTGDPYRACVDIDECTVLSKPCGKNAICENAVPGYNCLCPQGYEAQPTPDIACEQVDVATLCKSNFDCINNAECVDGQCFCRDGFVAKGATCVDVDECAANPCGSFAVCTNTAGSHKCECEAGFVGKPPITPCKAPCEDVKCGPHATCKTQGQEAFCVCDEGWTYDPTNITAGCQDIDECEVGQGLLKRCGENAICTNIPGSFTCQCPPGFSGNPSTRCLDIDECLRPDACGTGAICINTQGSYLCQCPNGTVPEPDANTKCVSVLRCAVDDDCPGNSVCDPTRDCSCPEPNVGPDCRHPCEDVRCTSNQECMLIGGVAKCMCSPGFTGGVHGGCVDIDECSASPCAAGAVCRNQPGKFSCECPSGYEGEPFKQGCKEVATTPPGCSQKNPCPIGEECTLDSATKTGVCICTRGLTRDQTTGLCRDVNECLESPADKPACGFGAICKNLPGSYECSCPPGSYGNPYSSCGECDSVECRCQPPYRVIGGACLLSDCAGGKQACPSGAECVTVTGGVSYCACPAGFRTQPDGSCEDINECAEDTQTCAFGAECINRPGKFECLCPEGLTGDPYKGGCSPSQIRCINDNECSTNEKCVQPGECICPPPYYTDTSDGNKCKSPCERFPCGVNSKCTPTDPPKCMCEPGHTGNPNLGCTDIDECKDNPCGPGAQCINENGGFKCRCSAGLLGDPYGTGCQGEARSECSSDTDCDGQLACVQGSCVNPCAALPCGSNAYCEPEDHAAWCRCLPGFKAGTSGACISLCDGVLCGENAQCVASSEGTTCACLEGYNGNPFPGGSCIPDVCSAANPCQEPQVCVSGRCKERCEDVTCGVGARCDKATNKCVCLPFFIGKPDLLCVPPVVPPICLPACGENAHCEYGLPNRCVCNPGTSGNPYESCGAQAKTCDITKCGVNAECKQGINRVDCVCPVGYSGNPYVACEDINECIGNACGPNAVCLNTPGSYDCQCQEGFSGNPFMMCMPGGPPTSPVTCEGGSLTCDSACSGVVCGPNAACSNGLCVCLPGFSGDPSPAGKGCGVSSCRNDLDCSTREVCLHVNPGASDGPRHCVDACIRVQCGPNAVCLGDKHRSSCVCQDGFFGNPNDLQAGCQQDVATDRCSRDDECPGHTVCHSDINGVKNCVDLCRETTCGQNEICRIKDGKPHCECQANFVRNPVAGLCEKPSLPDCVTDADCRNEYACRQDVLGVLKCTLVCTGFTCPPNSDCKASNHVGQCVCRGGFTGNPNDRNGCRSVPKDQCESDAQCPEVETCQQVPGSGIRRCVPVCNAVQCGPNAICVANNHAAKCQCPVGLYAGDPSGPTGCLKVECLTNNDCSPTTSCHKPDNKCIPVCVSNSCGKNAICLSENHMAMCSCPAGFEPNPHPEIECLPADMCATNPCHKTALCQTVAGKAVCSCQPDTIGDPYAYGCRANGTCPGGDNDCPSEAACFEGRCVDPCDGFCGPNSACKCTNHKPICSCPAGFTPNPTPDKGCIRSPQTCRSDADCSGSTCVGGECKVVCRAESDCAQGERCVNSRCSLLCLTHSQCPAGQACVGGSCVMGCRGNSDCPANQACLNNKCESPCQREGICGVNARCNIVDRSAQCECPAGFIGGPTAQQGCMRTPISCAGSVKCPAGMVCSSDRCYPTCTDNNNCAGGERCVAGNCIKVCYSDNNCLAGEVCIDGGCRPGCRSDADCSAPEVCSNSQCQCAPGYTSGPAGCVDVNECSAKACHPSATCTNTPGSFRCTCPEGTVGDAYNQPGCVASNQCVNDAGCSDKLACVLRSGAKTCADPCASTVCGPNAVCTVAGHRPFCSCPQNTRGDPNDQTLGCFRVDCTENEDCPFDRACDKATFKCYNPCDLLDCYNGLCQVKGRQAVCQCAPGFKSTPSNACTDIDECSSKPCHPSAVCRNTPGSYQCVCGEGLVGDPFKGGCRKPGQCVTDSDCPLTAACVAGTCKDPCGLPEACGVNAECLTENHTPVCRCPFQTTGNPKEECYTLQCVDSLDCAANEQCVRNKCVDPCKSPTACGVNSECAAVNHRAVCSCRSGFTGNPTQGCVAVVYCTSEAQCPTSQTCVAGICASKCSSSRDCVASQQCIEGNCRPACSDSSQCPDSMHCVNSVCVQAVRCRSSTDCSAGEACLTNDNGQAACRNPCDGPVLCGRNAICVAEGHQAVCRCKDGFFGSPQDDKVGCLKIECTSDSDCSADKKCHEQRCKIACMVDNQCGKNTLCFSEKHAAVCKCQPGYTGDVTKSCTPIDYCAQIPCAAGAKCENTRGSYKCFCPTGKVGEPYKEGCQQPVECVTNQDCPASAVCGRLGGQPKCIDACGSVLCGPNADCVPREHQGFCVCRNGFEGDANNPTVGCTPESVSCKAQADCPTNTYCYNGLCKAACISSNECLGNEACIQGQCSSPCLADGSCGMNAECRAENHEAVCSCPDGFTGNAAKECIRVPVACQKDDQCSGPAGLRCLQGRCVPSCTADSQCVLNEKCVEGSCLLTCRLDNDCFLSHICLNGLCAIGCRANEDCSADEACINSHCKNPCSTPSVCGPNALCTVANHRAQCTCPVGFLAYPSPNVACVREPTPCTDNKACPNGFVCQNTVCRPLCSTESQCLPNERCDNGVCVPVCVQDGDCRSGEICSSGMCLLGCRADPDCPSTESCVNSKCVSPCASATACGTNAKCVVVNHREQCTCGDGLVGNAKVSCRYPPSTCKASTDCLSNQRCAGGMCRPACKNDQGCLTNDRCVKGVCSPVCNSDASCDRRHICNDRVCVAGCRSDSSCPANQACINNICSDPCEAPNACGACAQCEVVNHAAQCTCPAGTIGNPQTGCSKAPVRCTSKANCPSGSTCSSGYCSASCSSDASCSCGESCVQGRCRMKCGTDNQCPQGQVCTSGTCVAGCRSNSDCTMEQACVNSQCKDPCSMGPCGLNAECRISDHRAVCFCPSGFSGKPTEQCIRNECESDSDCDMDKSCVKNKCVLSCLEPGACGVNSQCRAVSHKAQCLCPIGYFGNAKIECKQDVNECLTNPCGANAICTDTVGSYTCTCEPGCVGDPVKGCLCTAPSIDPCSDAGCGINAQCRTEGDRAVCYCPPNYPSGNPRVECSVERPAPDCRTEGCGEGANCVPDGKLYICRCPAGLQGNPEVRCSTDRTCSYDYDCPAEKACVSDVCQDPCSFRGACGENALCRVVLHKARCSCPQCYVGRPTTQCVPDPRCGTSTTTVKPAVVATTARTPITSTPATQAVVGCTRDGQCHASQACNTAVGTCQDPCDFRNKVCDQGKRCEVRHHRPLCVCKHGFVLNDAGEMTCGPNPIECRVDDDCASNLACVTGRCQSPCAVRNPCAASNKTCQVLDHKPVCICVESCTASVSICLRDRGCPLNLACVDYQCRNPCDNFTCPENRPCYVEEHKAVCKFCPPGFSVDPQFGCIKVIGCRADTDCSPVEACINGKCQNPCEARSPCDASAKCEVRNRQAFCPPTQPVVGECPPCRANEECDRQTLTCRPGPLQPIAVVTEPSKPSPLPSSTPGKVPVAGETTTPMRYPPATPPSVEFTYPPIQPVVEETTPLPGRIPGAAETPMTYPPATPPSVAFTYPPIQPVVEETTTSPPRIPTTAGTPMTYPPVTPPSIPFTLPTEPVVAEVETPTPPTQTYKPQVTYPPTLPTHPTPPRIPSVAEVPTPYPPVTTPSVPFTLPTQPVVAETPPTPPATPRPPVGTYPTVSQLPPVPEYPTVPPPHAAPPSYPQPPTVPVVAEFPTPQPPGPYPPAVTYPPSVPTKPAVAEVTNPPAPTVHPVTGQPPTPVPVAAETPAPRPPTSPSVVEYPTPPPYQPPHAETPNPYPPAPTQPPAAVAPPPTVPVVAETPVPPVAKPPVVSYPPGPTNIPAVAEVPSPPAPTHQPGTVRPPPTVPVVAETPSPLPPSIRPPVTYPPNAPHFPPVAESPEGPVPTHRPETATPPQTVPVVAETSAPQQPTPRPPAVAYPPAPSSIPPVAETPLPPAPTHQPPSVPPPPTVPVVAESAAPQPPTPRPPAVAYPPAPSSIPPVAETPIPPAPTHQPPSVPPPPTVPVVAETSAPQPPTSRPPAVAYPPAPSTIPAVAETPVPPRPTEQPATIRPPPTVPVVAETPAPRPPTQPSVAELPSPPPHHPPVAETPRPHPQPTLPPAVVSSPPPFAVVAETPAPRPPSPAQSPVTYPPAPPSLPAVAEVQTPPAPTHFEITSRPPLTVPVVAETAPTSPPKPSYPSPVTPPRPPVAPVEAEIPTARPPPTHDVVTARPPPSIPVVAETQAPRPPTPKPPAASYPQGPPSIPPEAVTHRPPLPTQGEVQARPPASVPVVAETPAPRPPPPMTYPTTQRPPRPPTAPVVAETPSPPYRPSYQPQVTTRPPPPTFPVVAETPAPRPPFTTPRPIFPQGPPGLPPQAVTQPPLQPIYGQATIRPPATVPVIAQTPAPRPPPVYPAAPVTRPPVVVQPPAPVTNRPVFPPPVPQSPVVIGCTYDADCAEQEACVAPNCVNPCAYRNPCAPNAMCTVSLHQPVCACKPGFSGLATIQCRPVVVGECRTNDDCSYDRYCDTVSYQCVPVCQTEICGKLASCTAVNHYAVCSCLEGYVGNPRQECYEQPKPYPPPTSPVGFELCNPGPCGPNAECLALLDREECRCKPGFVMDALGECRQPPVQQPCIPSPCGPNADCSVGPTNNPICACRPGFFGDAQSAKGCGPECTTNSECTPTLACINQKCRDPCPGTCGQNAVCRVVDHNPVCACVEGFTGNAYQRCTPIPVVVAPVSTRKPTRPPSAPVVGTRPECVLNSDCPSHLACVNQQCRDPCPGVCGPNAICKVSNHNPICTCMQGYVGEPTRQCGVPVVPELPREPVVSEPCTPSPCGPYGECRVVNSQPVCSCLPGYFGNPCRPECSVSSDCPPSLHCVNQKCRDPCPGVCGAGAVCTVRDHNPICSCPSGMTGDPFIRCFEPVVVQQEPSTSRPINPCNPSPCGPGAQCKQQGSNAICSCPPGYLGDPYSECRPECVQNSECPRDKACVNNRCVNPCPGVCGLNAECRVINHAPVCSCIQGYTGDASTACRPIPVESRPIEPVVTDSCTPSPCGPNSICRNINGIPSCSCQPNFIGVPPECRPECVSNSECPSNMACISQRCRDPCPGVCGENAECRVVNHNPICNCARGFTGDPFIRCQPIPVIPQEPVILEPANPCIPSPCGPNSQCQVIGSQAKCSCQPNMIGNPPDCRPECIVNSDCPSDRACVAQRCRNPCPGTCGENTECRVVANNPVCSCLSGYTGDPFRSCVPILPVVSEPITPAPPRNPCLPSPCGSNAVCRQQGESAVCQCMPDYFGNAVQGCKPECVLNSDCASTKACVNQRCVDPCPGLCGPFAECRVVNHFATCLCVDGYTGNPFESCKPIPVVPVPPREPVVEEKCQPCSPSPCGPYSICREVDCRAVCSCQASYVGAPPACRPECVLNSDCDSSQACINQKCANPCAGICGENAECRVVNHNPICNCPRGFTGDPFITCRPIPVVPAPPVEPTVVEPCVPSPCGPYSACQPVGDRAQCSCLPNMIGVAPNCRPECVINSDCPSSRACINMRCMDPCPGSCGPNTECRVIGHTPTCSCAPGFTGNAFEGCQKIPVVVPNVAEREPRPCEPSPCGTNAECREQGNKAACFCPPDYVGDPFVACRPECLLSADCPSSRACIRNKCVDPCPGLCGINAECRVANHIPVCSCQQGFTGDPYSSCRPIPVVAETPVRQPPKSGCTPFPCGLNAECRDVSGAASCQCPPNYIGDPYVSCRPECVLNADCPQEKSCVRNRCENPCADACGTNADCRVANHNPVCVCREGYTGNPFSSCAPIPVVSEPTVIDRQDVCNPNPCGTNAECRGQNDAGVCVCLPGLIGDPYVSCRPECTTNSDCPNTFACIAQKCRDPCPGTCGIDAKCQVVGHNPVCSCPPGYVGDPFVQCKIQPISERVECEVDNDCSDDKACIQRHCRNPCQERADICAPNALCRVTQHRPVCVCPEGYTGNPQVQCFIAGCRADSDCQPTEACINRECKNPCIYEVCGTNAECRVSIHRAQCYCPERYEGDAYKACRLPECIIDDDCPSHLACRNQRCRDPCDCHPSAKCIVTNHIPQCACPPGTKGDPFIRGCVIEQPQPVVKEGCTSDAECPSKHACFNGECVNPCTVIRPCGINAQCLVIDSLPLRTMTCQCLPGYFGNPNVECRSVPIEEPGCAKDDDCPLTQACRNRQCVSPCVVANPCAPNALCTVADHKAKCECPDDFTGNPNINCYQIPKQEPECRVDSDCPTDRACTEAVCQDPCVVRNPCGLNAVCRTQQHRPVCFCPDGWGGDPHVQCFKPECEVDEDCPSDRACITGKCLNPCVFGGDQCGTNALCRVVLHRAQCYCPPGMQGNPTVVCVPVGCQSHDDCATDEVCDRLNRICVKVCDTVTCAPRATCEGREHQAICNCPPGLRGNPYVRCAEAVIPTPSPPRPECRSDPECPSREVCINNKCVDPCGAVPCGEGQLCSVVDSLPLRTVVCQCPADSFLDQNSRCVSAVIEEPNQVAGCTTDDTCPPEKACRNGVCEDPCDCAPSAKCRVIGHKPVCACPEGYTGDPLKGCFKVGCTVDEECPGTHACINGQCQPVCNPVTCESGAICQGIRHKAVCECPPGTRGNPDFGCKAIGCSDVNDCPPDQACFNGVCSNPCSLPNVCDPTQECKPFNHTVECLCPPGFQGTPDTACRRVDLEVGCRADSDCPSLEACINRQCVDPCKALEPCAETAECQVRPTEPHRTMICVCPPGTVGYAAVRCVPAVTEVVEECVLQKGQIRLPNGTCICDPLKELVLAPNGTCVCDETKGLVLGPSGVCVSPPIPPECVSDSDCPDDKFCKVSVCVPPCAEIVCHPNSECTAFNHRAQCNCIPGFTFKDDEVGCIAKPPPFRTDFPRPDIVVNCLADGVQVDIHVGTPGFDGVLYVKGHSKDESCRRVLEAGRDVGSIDYKVRFSSCGLDLIDGEASFILVIQKHPKLMTFKAQAYQVRCVYDTAEKSVTVGFNVSMLTTAGTISNTGPPPVCTMKICLPTGQEVRRAVIGDNLMLKVQVEPIGIYGGFARSCYAVTDNNTHLVTDENGCATDPTIFGQWELNSDNVLVASFNAFKFPASDNIRFQCNIRVCFGKCHPVNCDGSDSFGRRRRQAPVIDSIPSAVSANLSAVQIRESIIDGQLREEIMVQSNSILALDHGGEERFSAPTEAPDVVRQEVCVSTMGFIIALIITALLALVAVAVAVSCWLMAYRRRPKVDGPLPHPAEFPNPLFTTPEPLAEPSPDYLN